MAIDKKKQPVKTTIRQYVDNPSGRGSAYLASRKAIKQGLNSTFIKLLSRFRQQFFAIPYKYSNGDILMHIKVPSEDYDKNKISYDVLFKIEFNDKVRYSQRNIKLFSNSPSFLFTYAYVFYHSSLIPDEFVSKLPNIAITQAPVVRNPVEALGYEKSTYMAARYMLDGFVLNDNYINRFGKIMNPLEEKRLLASIADPEKLVQIYAYAKELQAKKKNKPVNTARREKREELRREYITASKQNRPKKTGFIIKRGPQSKITAKQAKRSLMND
jgi:hypothetical protein